MNIETINPATEEKLASYPVDSEAEIDRKLQRAHDAFQIWRQTPIDERAEKVRNIARVLRANVDKLAPLMTAEMGKTITEAEAEVEKSAGNCDYYADNGPQMLKDEIVATTARESYVAFEPLGTILAVMPWNFPIWQLMRHAAPALVAGNTVVLKHASNVTGCALAMVDIVREAGLPEGAVEALVIPGSMVDRVIGDPRIAAVTLTGSDAVGSKVAEAAGRHIKKTVLELGGSDAFVVLEDADLDKAAQFAARSRFQNAGQVCISAKRFIVADKVADEFVERFREKADAIVWGDPTSRDTRMGPMARKDLRDEIERQLDETLKAGADLVTGGKRPEGTGYYYPPTIVDNVGADMTLFREESFGPVAAIIRVPDEQAAIASANDSPYGLGSALWTQDIERGKRLARQIEAGGVFINGMTTSNWKVPFGGVKRSGYGRELSSYGMREFVNIQT
ncbi:MAG: NAD-dependent succinate-semialdehyde dehydrogenase, partial [Chloroflexota bacterium]|nr:NAD-dependent succinate-semialdehyde dehydrogenase [Chloroflexota bacterium]